MALKLNPPSKGHKPEGAHGRAAVHALGRTKTTGNFKKIEASKALDASTMKLTDSTTARELQAIQMASFFVGKFYKIAELFSVEIEKTAEEIEAIAIAEEIAEKVISLTGK